MHNWRPYIAFISYVKRSIDFGHILIKRKLFFNYMYFLYLCGSFSPQVLIQPIQNSGNNTFIVYNNCGHTWNIHTSLLQRTLHWIKSSSFWSICLYSVATGAKKNIPLTVARVKEELRVTVGWPLTGWIKSPAITNFPGMKYQPGRFYFYWSFKENYTKCIHSASERWWVRDQDQTAL